MDSIFIQHRSIKFVMSDSSRRVSAPFKFKVDPRSCQDPTTGQAVKIKDKRVDSEFDLAQSFRFFIQFSEFESFHFFNFFKKAQSWMVLSL